MHIGFDAKRAFLNRSGLGNYSRFVIQSLLKFHKQNRYYLFTPSVGEKFFENNFPNADIILPERSIDKLFPAIWRSSGILNDIKVANLSVYHGLSGEIPHKLVSSGVKSIVTIHDLIFLRYPEFYTLIDRTIYKKKFSYACENADRIVAISEQTKSDIMEYLNISDERIKVIYQGCDARFMVKQAEEKTEFLKEKYSLPASYLLYVGTIEERKNLMSVLQALNIGKLNIPLVVIGKQTDYYSKIKDYIHKHKLENIIFLSGVPNEDLPGIYQKASLFIYPSIFEGFGIPILEALYSKVPVITSTGSCFREAGGPNTVYIDPRNPEQIAAEILRVIMDSQLSNKMIDEGYKHAISFDHEKIANQYMNLYKKVLNE